MKLILQRSPDGALLANVAEGGLPIGTAMGATIEYAVTTAVDRLAEDAVATAKQVAENIDSVDSNDSHSDEETVWAVIDGIRAGS